MDDINQRIAFFHKKALIYERNVTQEERLAILPKNLRLLVEKTIEEIDLKKKELQRKCQYLCPDEYDFDVYFMLDGRIIRPKSYFEK